MDVIKKGENKRKISRCLIPKVIHIISFNLSGNLCHFV